MRGWWWWNGGSRVVGVVHGALLGPEATGPVPLSRVASVPGRWGWWWLFLVPGAPWGWWAGVSRSPPACGVCGLLFENCIVDASILRTGAVGGLLLVGGAVAVSCS